MSTNVDILPRVMHRIRRILSGLSHLDLKDDIVDKQERASGLGGTCDVYSACSRKHTKKVAGREADSDVHEGR